MKLLINVLSGLSFVLMMPQLAAMNANILTVGYAQTEVDYLDNGIETVKPKSQTLSYSYQFNDAWATQLSYEKINIDGRWLSRDDSLFDNYGGVEANASSFGLGIVWQSLDYSLAINYINASSSDHLVVSLPSVNRRTNSDIQMLGFGFEQSISIGGDEGNRNDNNDWNFDWGLGAQYVKFDVDIFNTIGTQSPIVLERMIQQSDWSTYLDLGMNYWVDEISFSWSPYVLLSWSWDVESQGEQHISLTREGSERIIDQAGERFSTQIRAPESGTLEIGLNIMWGNDRDTERNTNMSYGLTLSSEFNSDNYTMNFSVFF